MKKWMNRMMINAMVKVQAWKQNEEGMEIIQVLVLLALGVGLIMVFMTFSTQIKDIVTEKVGNFITAFGSAS